MKKYLILLFAVSLTLSCKSKEDKAVGANDQSEKLTVSDEGDTTVSENNMETAEITDTNGDINTGGSEASVIDPQQKALQKNADGTYTFRYNLKKGDTYPFVLRINQSETYSHETETVKVTSGKTVEFDYLVKDIVNNRFLLQATFRKFTETATGPDGKTISYNTGAGKPSDNEVAQSWIIYKAIVGETFEMEMDNQGRVHNVNGLDKVVTNVQNKIKNDFNEEERKFLKEMLTYSLSNESIVGQFEESLNIFPEKNIKVGEEWSDSQSLNEGPLKGSSNMTRKFKSLNGGTATITVSGKQNVKGSETQEGITASMSSDATVNGEILVDEDTGWLKKVNMTKSETMSNSYSMGDQKRTEKATSVTTTTVN